ncbi:hypothetical protein CEXT_458221 [Caerostris extrusa]|uniref:Uncharacterized protein n=1 Tax=Caerostris extrusa TaxID=172846 RepID=A0AAV4YCF4_CAEEX|nr:hypothetical protein CEXT_458221 [Caerostris extrusa]
MPPSGFEHETCGTHGQNSSQLAIRPLYYILVKRFKKQFNTHIYDGTDKKTSQQVPFLPAPATHKKEDTREPQSRNHNKTNVITKPRSKHRITPPPAPMVNRLLTLLGRKTTPLSTPFTSTS